VYDKAWESRGGTPHVDAKASGMPPHLACASPLLPTFPKPPSRKHERHRVRRHRARVIAEIRSRVVERDTTCRVCGRAFGWGEQTPEMHELVSRASQRGKAPEEVFTLTNCVLLHRQCHRAVTERQIILEPQSAEGANGPLHIRKSKGDLKQDD
jgi:5-methylcytosine-specific restriction endonuclease McrA